MANDVPPSFLIHPDKTTPMDSSVRYLKFCNSDIAGDFLLQNFMVWENVEVNDDFVQPKPFCSVNTCCLRDIVVLLTYGAVVANPLSWVFSHHRRHKRAHPSWLEKKFTRLFNVRLNKERKGPTVNEGKEWSLLGQRGGQVDLVGGSGCALA